jgi:phosphosulfolactate synthase (CoM biosynthesis protein A)
MAKKKMSVSAKIRNLLDKGLEPQAIAKRLDITPAYVHTIKWSWKNAKAKGKSAKVNAVEVTSEVPAVAETMPVFNTNLEQYVRDMIAAQVSARVQNIFEGIR